MVSLETRENAERARGTRRWPLLVSGTAVLAWWAYPLVHPLGVYGSYYRFFDIEIGLVASLLWVARLAVALAPERLRRALALRLTVALGAVLITAACCDAAATVWAFRFGQIWYHGHSFPKRDNVADPELIWKHKPGLSWFGRKTPGCRPSLFRTDEQGFRNPPGIAQADLVFIGDSVTEAGEVAEGETFVRRVATATGLSAVNLGVFGYGPQQELRVLERYGMAYRPRAVVWQVTEWNDPMDAERYASRNASEGHARPSLRALYEAHSPLVWLIGKAFPPRPRHLIDFGQTDGRTVRRVMRPPIDSAARWPAGLSITEQTIAAAQSLCRARGIAFVVLFVPDYPRVLAAYVQPSSHTDLARYAPACLDHPGDMAHALVDHCQRSGCSLIDLTGPLRRRAEADNRNVYVRNDTHLGVDGHDEAARALIRWLGVSAALTAPKERMPATAHAAPGTTTMQ